MYSTTMLFAIFFALFASVGCMIQEPKEIEGKTASISQMAERIVFKDYPLNRHADSVWAVQEKPR